MKRPKIYNYALIIGCCLYSAPAGAEPQLNQSSSPIGTVTKQASKPNNSLFLETLHDIPLIPGAHELAESSISFDTPGGRIMKTTAFSESLSIKMMQDYYLLTLPQFGWAHKENFIFTREDEKMTLQFESQDTLSLVTFSLEPI